jgi:hypothetical protein
MLLLLKVILQITAVGLAVLVGALDYVWHDKRTRRFKHTRKLLFVFVAIFLFTSVLVTVFDDLENNRKEAELRGQLVAVQEQNDSLQKQQQFTLNNVTGGDSFCYIKFILGKSNRAGMWLVSRGEYPLYGVHGRIWNPDDNFIFQENTNEGILMKRKKDDITFGPIDLPPNRVATLTPINLPVTDKEEQRIIVNFSARNGVFREVLRLRRINGEWKGAFKVYRDPATGPVTLLYEETDKDFPPDNPR